MPGATSSSDPISVSSVFWDGWLRYRQSLQSQHKRATDAKRGHCERFYPFWNIFGLSIVTFASMIVWWATRLATGPWFLFVVFFYLAAWRTSTEIRHIRRQRNLLKRAKYAFRLHSSLAVLASSTALVSCSVFAFPLEIAVAVCGITATFLSVHYLYSFINLREIWILPSLLAYLIAVSIAFSLWYVSWNPEHEASGFPLWLWVMVGGGAFVLVQLFIFVTWRNWLDIMHRVRRFSRALGEESSVDPLDDDEEEVEEDFSRNEFAALNDSPITLPLVGSAREYPSYQSLLQAGTSDASAVVAAAGSASGSISLASTEHNSRIGMLFPKNVAPPQHEYVEVEYVGTPSRPIAAAVTGTAPYECDDFGRTGEEESIGSGSPTVDVFLEGDPASLFGQRA